MTEILLQQLATTGLAPPLSLGEGERFSAGFLNPLTQLDVYERSITATGGSVFFMGSRNGKKYLGVISTVAEFLQRFESIEQQSALGGHDLHMIVASLTSKNALAIREAIPFLKPRTLGLVKSIGCGDRLGMGTSGHLRAVRKTGIAPILAQQSVRENERTGRSPREVLDDAVWGVFQEGWRAGFGADADHLKTKADVQAFADAGYSFYTIDPGTHVDNQADRASGDLLLRKVEAVPWDELEITAADVTHQLSGRPMDLSDFKAQFSKEEILRAAVKYGRVVVHTVQMHRTLLNIMQDGPFELEVSVDETESVTTLAEHVYIAHELKRLGVKWVSLAPRYVGDFEKGVDYIGDVQAFEKSFFQHVGVARTFGPYKLSLHSGSDKLSIYPIIGKLAGDLCHVKTAGTSYLEALRTLSRVNSPLFRHIVRIAMEHYDMDRATYHVSAEISKVPDLDALSDEALSALLDDFHAREVLHVTYGSVIHHPALRDPFFETLRAHEEDYARALETHFDTHLRRLQSGEGNEFP
jgi:hypothetical protein